MTTRRTMTEQGAISGWMISTIGLAILLIATGIVAVDAYQGYNAQKTDVDGKISLAVAAAKNAQATTDDADFAQKAKQPNTQFVGPSDYGRLTFDYPRTWSVYVSQDGTEGNTYSAYLNPVTVPPVNNGGSQIYALEVNILEADYGTTVNSYQSQITQGTLTSSVVTANGVTGTRLDGTFSDGIRGSEVIYKIRDKTVTIRTDANTFLPDFNALIQTIKFNS